MGVPLASLTKLRVVRKFFIRSEISCFEYKGLVQKTPFCFSVPLYLEAYVRKTAWFGWMKVTPFHVTPRTIKPAKQKF